MSGLFGMDATHPDRKTHLILYLTQFIGRQQEVSEIRHLLISRRLLTLTGAGGIGKTRMALEVTADLDKTFPGGIWVVELAELADSALLSQAVMITLGLSDISSESIVETLIGFLHNRHTLLLLDNCEHLLDACAQLVATLLQNSPRLHLLATNREALNLPGEIVRPMLPLALPSAYGSQPLAELLQIESIALFLDRARMLSPDFQLTEVNKDSVIQICRLLDGIPLAIELAAARVSVLDTAQIADHLQNSLRLLVTAPRLATPRHQTMRATIDWSYSLLSEAEQMLWRRLAVFRGSFSLAAAAVVCIGEHDTRPDMPDTDFLESLSQLVAKSLVLIVPGSDERRYRLLEPMRQYAAEQLETAGEITFLHTRHRDWYLAWAESHQPGLFGSQQNITLQKFDLEYANLRAALAWHQDDPQDALVCLRLAAAVAPLWFLTNRFIEGHRWLSEALNRPGTSEPTLTRSHVLYFAGVLTWFQGDFPLARRYIEASHEIVVQHQHEGRWGIAYTLMMLGQVVRFFPDEEQDALHYLTESVEHFRRNGDHWGLALTLNCLGSVYRQIGDVSAARACFIEARTILQTLGDPWITAHNKFEFFLTAVSERDHATAQALYEENRGSFEALGYAWHQAYVSLRMGEVCLQKGDYPAADEHLQRCLGFSRRVGHKIIETSALAGLSLVALMQGRTAEGAAQLQDVLMRFQHSDHHIEISFFLKRLSSLAEQSGYPHLAAYLKAVSATADNTSGDETATLTAALNELQHLALNASPATSQAIPFNLTHRELEVLRLVADGLTDPQIAERLVVSKRTVNAHLRSIYSKLDVTTRTAATRLALEQNLL
jgi:predicted ATPase/DNA-binding CsgD family transcriptional regulator